MRCFERFDLLCSTQVPAVTLKSSMAIKPLPPAVLLPENFTCTRWKSC